MVTGITAQLKQWLLYRSMSTDAFASLAKLEGIGGCSETRLRQAFGVIHDLLRAWRGEELVVIVSGPNDENADHQSEEKINVSRPS